MGSVLGRSGFFRRSDASFREGSLRAMLFDVSYSCPLWVIESYDFIQRWKRRNVVCGEAPRHDGGLDAALRESARGPIARHRQVVVGGIEGRDSMLERPRQSQAISIGGLDIRSPVLRSDACLARSRRFALLGTDQE